MRFLGSDFEMKADHRGRWLLMHAGAFSFFAIAWALFCTPQIAVAQDNRFNNRLFGDLIESDDDDSPEYTLSGDFTVEQGSRNGLLSVTMDIKPKWHAYSLNKLDGQTPTVITVTEGEQFRLTGPFLPDHPPHVVVDQGAITEQYEGQVRWSAPLEFAKSVDPQNLVINLRVTGQVCARNCIPIGGDRAKVAAKFAGYTESSKSFTTDKITISGFVEENSMRPGDQNAIRITAKIRPGWHIYRFDEFKPEGTTPLPTIIYFTKTADFTISPPKAEPEPIQQEFGIKDERYVYLHENEVSWTIPIIASRDAQSGKVFLEGQVMFQVCSEEKCEPTMRLVFSAPVTIGDNPSGDPAAIAFQSHPPLEALEETELLAASKSFWADMRAKLQAEELDPSQLALYLFFGFVAGLILNAMPCVLPVIGLKVMSFVQQAGEQRGRIFLLNLVFSLGLLSVFWVLATLSAFFGYGWGDWLTKSLTGSIVITSVVFAFGLSLLGIWEIPIPGLSGAGSFSQKSSEEGLLGAFFLGILTTILATPCTGPLLIPAITFTAGQPPWVAYLIFTFIGLGMALPYLLIGIFPSLINWLPRPGAWMSTFKQITGFILMATVVFLMGSYGTEPRNEYLLAMLSLLLAIAIACWWIGRTSLAAEPAEQYRAWASGLIMIGVGAVLAFNYLGPPKYRLDWQLYSEARLGELRDESRVVLIDFTGPN
jgi:thiol:disulfide interchange protein